MSFDTVEERLDDFDGRLPAHFALDPLPEDVKPPEQPWSIH